MTVCLDEFFHALPLDTPPEVRTDGGQPIPITEAIWVVSRAKERFVTLLDKHAEELGAEETSFYASTINCIFERKVSELRYELLVSQM